MSHKKTIRINGVAYYKARPKRCERCYFWKNNKKGCRLGKDNCYYLAETVKDPAKEKCEGCPYRHEGACVSLSCYKDLDKWLKEHREQKGAQSNE